MPLSQKAFLFLMVVAGATAIAIPISKPDLFSATGWVTYAGASFTLLGFLVREFFAIRTVRKQHTVSILLQSRLSVAFNDRHKTLLKMYPATVGVTSLAYNDWRDPQKVEAIEALKYLLNYYEFIAIGIRTGDLDEEYLYMSLSSIVSNLCTMGAPYIQTLREHDSDIYCNLIWLRQRWDERK